MWIWLILLVVTAVIVSVSVRPADCVIRFRDGNVSIKGRIAEPHRIAVTEYLSRHFADATLRITVQYPRRGLRLRIGIHGPLAEGDRQMLRNFFFSEFGN